MEWPTMSVRFLFGPIHLDAALNDRWDGLLRPVADLSLQVGDTEVFSEYEVCVVELAAALAQWIPRSRCAAFTYSSLESADDWLIRFIPWQEHMWRVEGRTPSGISSAMAPVDDLEAAASEFLKGVYEGLPARDRVLTLLADGLELPRELPALWSQQ
jgi:hypothetical protein